MKKLFPLPVCLVLVWTGCTDVSKRQSTPGGNTPGNATEAEISTSPSEKSRSPEMDILFRMLQQLPGIKLEAVPHGQIIHIGGSFPPAAADKLLALLQSRQQAVSLHDPVFPYKTDDGSYLNYWQDKESAEGYWNMTLGNQGWSDGIYQVKQSTVIAQMRDLLKRGMLKSIELENKALFLYYDRKTAEESLSMDKRIMQAHQ